MLAREYFEFRMYSQQRRSEGSVGCIRLHYIFEVVLTVLCLRCGIVGSSYIVIVLLGHRRIFVFYLFYLTLVER